MKKILLLTFLLVTISISLFSQTDKFWSVNNDNRNSIETDKAVSRITYPKAFKLFNLNIESLRTDLFSIVDNRSANPSIIITLPNADGNIEQFEVFEASNFEPALQERFPEIRAYSGRGITDKYATIKLSISPQGVQTMVFRTAKENEFIEPYSKDHTIYSVYRSHRDKGALPWTCTTQDQQMFSGLNEQVTTEATGSSSGTIKTLRLAQSCNGEYANFFGASTAGTAADEAIVLSAFNATLTRCNGVYEKDLALHLNLIESTTDVIYYNPNTDPYSRRLNRWNAELQSTLTSVIGEANYDIGHMFGGSGGGGNAGCIGCVCVNGQKGSGITSPADGIPMGDNFDIDYVAHEVGHQLGGNHTFSMSLEGTGQNKEVGSGITIMGYAGITSYDVAPHSIDIFHETTIGQIQANIATKSCPVPTNMTANTAPVVSPVSNYTIPKSTPFALTAIATDAQNDPLTYCWEQNDNSTTSGSNSVAYPTKTTGPNWLSFPATATGTRLFPGLSTILAGLNVTPSLPGGDAAANIEALSSVPRTLNFRVTVRDNHPYVAGSTIGQTAFTDAVVTVSNTGPFAVTVPNTNVTWNAGSNADVTWSVNGSNGSPVNCANVKISLSTDGGETFPTVLAASTLNDGTEAITVPATPSTTCRIKVEAVGNIFFDISNTNFTITGSAACSNPTGLVSSAVTTNSATVSWSAVPGALNYDVEYSVAGNNNWINVATATTSTSANVTGLSPSTQYDWRVRANCSGASSNYAIAQFTTSTTSSCNAPAGLTSSNISSTTADVSWNVVSGASSYDVDYSTTLTGNNWTSVATGTTLTSVTITGLTMSTQYYWRVIANCTATAQSSEASVATFTTSEPTSCPGVYDVSANGNISGAALIPFDTNIFGLISQSFEVDHYKFAISTSGTISMTLTNLPTNYNLRLLNSVGSILATSANNGPNDELINFNLLSAGTYYARVYPSKKNDWDPVNCYKLRVNLGTATRNGVNYYTNIPKVSVFPNPANEIANLVFNMDKTSKAVITVTNQLGAIVLTQSIIATEGKNTRNIDVSKLPNGLYFISIQTGEKTAITKIVISK